VSRGRETFDDMLARVGASRETSMAKDNPNPFAKKGEMSKDKKGKPFGKGKATFAQKSMRGAKPFGGAR
jgi:hypothetical protein